MKLLPGMLPLLRMVWPTKLASLTMLLLMRANCLPKMQDPTVGLPRMQDPTVGLPRMQDPTVGLPRMQDPTVGLPKMQDPTVGLPRI
jgi:hypothetical protein